ncbi:MAG: hypothetical protein JRI91_15685 [Deltaproteobacteria bacterium]|nr:hypothetical protein [Deltaproteobacteria bacterium]
MKKETYTSIFILILLVGIGTGVFIKQFYFSPAILSVHQMMPEGTEPHKPESNQPGDMSIPIPEGMASMTLPEKFSPDTLYEKINGKAELYLSAGFKSLLCQRMKSESVSEPGSEIGPELGSELWMEVCVYQMDNDTNAFAVYSRQRRSDGIALNVTEFSYRTGNAIFFTHGPYYIEVVGSASKDELLQYMYVFADRFIKNMSVENKRKPEFELFPQQDLIQKSISVIPSNAFGYEKLDNMYVATYKQGEKQATLFFSNRKTPKNAEDLSNGYKAFLKMFGGNKIPHDTGIENAQLVEIFGTYDLFFTKGPYFCGVHESEDIETAKKMAVNLFHSLKNNVDGKP